MFQSNRITKLEGLDSLESLEELYISHNGITTIEGLEKVVRNVLYIEVPSILCFGFYIFIIFDTF